jgi:hypothetical protein
MILEVKKFPRISFKKPSTGWLFCCIEAAESSKNVVPVTAFISSWYRDKPVLL